MTAKVHLVKLCVGAEALSDLEEWQRQRVAERRAARQDPRPMHVTRMWPRRADELLGGGSLYWVIKGMILARQQIAELRKCPGEDGIERCGIVLEPEIVRVAPRPRRPFQGWRYLSTEDAPPDLSGAAEDDLPPALAAELAAIGIF